MAQLMTRKQAEEVVDNFDRDMECWHECSAEAGMGAVSMGFDGYDGTSVFAQMNPQPTVTPEVQEAHDVLKMFATLEVQDCTDFGWWADREESIPEYRPGTPTTDCPF